VHRIIYQLVVLQEGRRSWQSRLDRKVYVKLKYLALNVLVHENTLGYCMILAMPIPIIKFSACPKPPSHCCSHSARESPKYAKAFTLSTQFKIYGCKREG
jgi:hypothetical protein